MGLMLASFLNKSGAKKRSSLFSVTPTRLLIFLWFWLHLGFDLKIFSVRKLILKLLVRFLSPCLNYVGAGLDYFSATCGHGKHVLFLGCPGRSIWSRLIAGAQGACMNSHAVGPRRNWAAGLHRGHNKVHAARIGKPRDAKPQTRSPAPCPVDRRPQAVTTP